MQNEYILHCQKRVYSTPSLAAKFGTPTINGLSAMKPEIEE
jgi:hypothetical protein